MQLRLEKLGNYSKGWSNFALFDISWENLSLREQRWPSNEATVFKDDGCHGCDMPTVHFPSAYLIRVVGWLEPTPAVMEQEEGYTPGLS